MRPYQNYQRVSVSTADPVRIIVLLYEGAIKNLNQALLLIGEDNTTASVRINKAQDIIHYLRNALDHEKGGEIATNLDRLYEYMRDTLNQANINCDKDKIQVVIGLLQTLLEGWRGIVAGGAAMVNGATAQNGDATPNSADEPASAAAPAARPNLPLGLSMMG